MGLALAVVLGLLIGAALGALGGGGSILAVPVLVYVAGQTAGAATATSLVAVGASAVVGAVGHARKGRVRWGAAAAFVVTGVGGSWLGAHVNERIDPDLLLLGFSVLILVAAHRMLTACPSCTRVGEQAVA
ncbi:MAG: sulfite exporter TauE/SafE family protein, partial [Acidimicrobiales bacterium]|nr:sulfite exporter TauE/SafE family protein [Acidimicrobiales bacterium]